MIPRTHVVDLYAWDPEKATGSSGQPIGGWGQTPVANAVECNLQPLRGMVQQTSGGRVVQGDWKGFFPSTTPLTMDPEMAAVVVGVISDGIAQSVPAAQAQLFRIRHVGWEGQRDSGGYWDTECLLEETTESIIDEVSP